MRTFFSECDDFSLNKCPIWTHDSATAKFSTNGHETDQVYSIFSIMQSLCTPEAVVTLPPFGPIEGQKWFFQISSQWESQRTGLHLSLSAKSSFYLPAFDISCSCRTTSAAVPVLQGEGLYGALAEGGPLQEELVLPRAVGVLRPPVSWQGQPRHACCGAAAA